MVQGIVKEGDLATAKQEGSIPLTQAVHEALALSTTRSERVFIVGGVVRDLLMQRCVGDYDLDLVVEGQGLNFAQDLAQRVGGQVRLHPPFLTAKLSSPFRHYTPAAPLLSEIDIATARTEVYERPGALPTVRAARIESDLWRRDFSINAMALPLAAYAKYLATPSTPDDLRGSLVDPCVGYAALNERFVRILHPGSFKDDPTRLFRALRYCARLSFACDGETELRFEEALKEGALATISPRRVWNEVLACLDEPAPGAAIRSFSERGLFSHFEVVSSDGLPRLLEMLDRLIELRGKRPESILKEAGKLLVVCALPATERERVVRAVQEKGALLQHADRVCRGEIDVREVVSLSAGYAYTGLTQFRDLIGSLSE